MECPAPVPPPGTVSEEFRSFLSDCFERDMERRKCRPFPPNNFHSLLTPCRRLQIRASHAGASLAAGPLCSEYETKFPNTFGRSALQTWTLICCCSARCSRRRFDACRHLASLGKTDCLRRANAVAMRVHALICSVVRWHSVSFKNKQRNLFTHDCAAPPKHRLLACQPRLSSN
jgi:hypothetical protein